MLKYFDSFTEFVATVQRFQKYLKGCAHCHFIWCSKKDIAGRQFNEEEMENIQRCIIELNNLELNVKVLERLKVEISHGICIPCWRLKRGEKVRREQQEMGYHPCYGTANDGHCTQTACKWFSVCVVDQVELAIWKQKIATVDATYVH
jgi:hypothetical protein